MPNHITNILTVKGDSAEVERLFSCIGGGADEQGNELLIDFNCVLPMPESLDIESGSRSDEGLRLYTLFIREGAGIAEMGVVLGISGTEAHNRIVAGMLAKYAKLQENDPDLWSLGEQCYNNIRDHGASTWYDWANQNWGTKWNAYSQKRLDGSTIQFQTAWSGVPKLIKTLSGQFPSLGFSYTYADEDWGRNAGEFQFKGGECVYEHKPANSSPEARRIAEELLGPAFSDGLEQDMEMEGME